MSWSVGSKSDVAFPTHHLASVLCEFPKRLCENVSLEPGRGSAVRARLVPAEMRRLGGGAHVLPRGGRKQGGAAGLRGVFCPRDPYGLGEVVGSRLPFGGASGHFHGSVCPAAC